VRSLGVLHALQQMGTVEVVILEDEGESGELVMEPGLDLRVAYTLEVKRRPDNGLIGKLRWTLDPRSDYPNGCGVGEEEKRRVQDSLKDYDLVWFFKLRSPDLFPNGGWPRSILDIDDVPSTCERVKLALNVGVRDRLETFRRLLSWRRRERLLADRFNVLTVCSEEDRRYLRKMSIAAPLHVIPNAFAKPSEEPVRCPATPPRVGFIGLLEHFPNRDGIHWFAARCWPLIKREYPDARLRLIGIGSDGPYKPDAQDVDGLGWLADPTEEIRTWSAMVVPIRIGGGTRVKIAEGFCHKCPIVSTPLGAYGYGALDGHDMYLASSPEPFADSCIRVIREPGRAAEMAERAWSEFLDKWTWDAVQSRVWAAAEDCLRLNARS